MIGALDPPGAGVAYPHRRSAASSRSALGQRHLVAAQQPLAVETVVGGDHLASGAEVTTAGGDHADAEHDPLYRVRQLVEATVGPRVQRAALQGQGHGEVVPEHGTRVDHGRVEQERRVEVNPIGLVERPLRHLDESAAAPGDVDRVRRDLATRAGRGVLYGDLVQHEHRLGAVVADLVGDDEGVGPGLDRGLERHSVERLVG